MSNEIKEYKIISVSEFANEIFAEHKVKLNNKNYIEYNELLISIWDIHPHLFISENYDIYWRYNETCFFKIFNYFSYLTAINLMMDDAFFVIIRDTEPWLFEYYYKCNICNRNCLDLNFKNEVESFYSEINLDTESKQAKDNIILSEALENFPVPKYYSTDKEQKLLIVNSLKQGYKKTRLKHVFPDDNVINLRPKIEKSKDKNKKGKGAAGKKKK